MNNDFMWLVIGFVLFIAIVAFSPEPQFKEYDKCVEIMNKAIPDPDDTEARAKLLEECIN